MQDQRLFDFAEVAVAEVAVAVVAKLDIHSFAAECDLFDSIAED